MLEQIISGIVGGAIYSLSGIAKNQDDNFSFIKATPTLVVGLVIGGIAGFLNLNYGIVENLTLSAGLTAVVENIGKAFKRKVLAA